MPPVQAGKMKISSLEALWPYDRKTTVSILYLAAIWLATHGYYGIRADGTLYTGQALSHLYPDVFRRDLFFLFGSQDDFTIFGRVYATLIGWIGLHGATLGLFFAAHAMWIAGASFVIRQVQQPALWWGSFALLLIVPGTYGSDNVFGYSEKLLTARIFAEAIGLASIALALVWRTLPSLAFGILAALFHPIIALPAIAYSVLHRLRFDTAVVLALAGLIIVVAIVAFLPATLPGRLGFMDDAWYALAVERSPFTFLDQWSLADFGEVVFLIVMLGYAALRAPAPLNAVSRTVLLVTALFLAVSCVGAATHHTLLIQAQLWRVLWLTKIFAILAAAWLFAQYWGKSRSHNLLLSGLAVAWLAVDSTGGYLSVPVCALLLWLDQGGKGDIPRYLELEGYVVLTVALLIGIGNKPWMVGLALMGEEIFSPLALVIAVNELGWVVLLLPLVLGRRLAVWDRWQHVAVVSVLVFLILSVFYWDRRFINSVQACVWTPGCLSEIDRYLPRSAVIYWQDALPLSWIVLRRPIYASFEQTAGLMFSRETAFEARRRVTRLEKLGVRDGSLKWPRGFHQRWIETKVHLRFDGLVHVCHDRAVDYLILEAEFGQASPRVFDEPLLKTRYYVYDCGLVRERFADPYAGSY